MRKTNLKNVYNDLMSPYNENIQRIIGETDSATYEISSCIVEHRQCFRDTFFHKYSNMPPDEEEVNMCTLIVHDRQPEHKSLNSIQHWINTGYLNNKTYESYTIKSEISDNSLPSRTEECLQLLQRDVKTETLDAQCTKQKYCGNSSSSSVNTPIYIATNMNVTNKAETITIIDGTNTPVTSRNTQNIQAIQFVTDEICAKKCKRDSTDENKNIIQMQEDLVKLEHNNKFCCKQLSDERIKHRRKLFTLTDSPTDLTPMQHSNNKRFKLQSNLHPALEDNSELEQRRLLKKREKDRFNRFHKNILFNYKLYREYYCKGSKRINNSNFSKPFVRTNNNEISNDAHSMNPNKSQDSIECKATKYTNMFLSANECINAQKQLNESKIYSERCKPNENKKPSIITDEYIRLNPSVYLTRIPDVEIQKYKNSNKETTNSCSFNDNDKHMNLNKSQDLIECKATKYTNMFLSANECINAQKQLNESKIYSERCKPNENKKPSIITDEYIRLNPSVYLTRIPEVDIQKYENSNKITTDCCSLNNNHKHRNQHSITNDSSDSSNESCYQIFKCEKQRSNVSAVSKTFKSVNPYNQRVFGINEKLSTDTFDSTDDEKKSTTSQNIRTRTSFNILQNYDRNRKETARNQLKLNTNKRNSTFKNSCRRRKQKLKKTHNTTKSNLRTLLSKKAPHEKYSVVISDTSSDMETDSCSCNSDTRKNNNEKSNMLLTTNDESEVFPRFSSWPEKFISLKDLEETDSDESNSTIYKIVTISSKGISISREETFSSMKNKSFKELKSDNNSFNNSKHSMTRNKLIKGVNM